MIAKKDSWTIIGIIALFLVMTAAASAENECERIQRMMDTTHRLYLAKYDLIMNVIIPTGGADLTEYKMHVTEFENLRVIYENYYSRGQALGCDLRYEE